MTTQRPHRFNVLLSAHELKKLRMKAEREGMTMSQWVRMMIRREADGKQMLYNAARKDD